MKLPMFQECACGHLGSRHREDGSCARCECSKFVHPMRSYAPQSAKVAQTRATPIRQIGARGFGQ